MTNRLNAGYLGWAYRAELEKNTWPFLVGKQSEFSSNNVAEITLGDVFVPKGGKPRYQCKLPTQLILITINLFLLRLIGSCTGVLENTTTTCVGYKNCQIRNPSPITVLSPIASGTKASSGIPFAVSASSFPSVKKLDAEANTGINYFLHLQDDGITDQQAMHSAKAILKHYSEEIPDKKIELFSSLTLPAVE